MATDLTYQIGKAEIVIRADHESDFGRFSHFTDWAAYIQLAPFLYRPIKLKESIQSDIDEWLETQSYNHRVDAGVSI